MSERQRHSTGGPWEDSFGYSRAVRAGDRIVVSGCTAITNGTVQHPGNPGGQARVALENAVSAVEALGGTRADIVQTRMYIVHRRDAKAVGKAHAEVLGDIRPAATMVVVAGLISSDLLVEIEVDAQVQG